MAKGRRKEGAETFRPRMHIACFIGLLSSNGSVEGTTCRWEGQPGRTGRILLGNWTTVESVRTLVDAGTVSVLGNDVESTLFEERRARSTTFADLDALLSSVHELEHVYLLKDGGWMYASWRAPHWSIIPER